MSLNDVTLDMLHKKPLFVVIPVIVIWLLLTVYGFWWFQMKDIGPFFPGGIQQAATFDSHRLHAQLQTNLAGIKSAPVATLFHFWDPDCPCNRFNEVHVREIIDKHASQGVQVVVLVRNRRVSNRDELLQQAKQKFRHPVIREVRLMRANDVAPPSSPAVAIIDDRRELAYFGPYSAGAMCSATNGGFVEIIMQELFSGKHRKQLNTQVTGCFCPWDKAAGVDNA